MSMLLTAAIAVADGAPPVDVDPSTGKGPEWGKAAPVGLLVILLLGIALFFLLRSMSRNLEKVPASFDPPEGDLPRRGEPPSAPPVDAHPTDGPADVDRGPDVEPGSPGMVNERSG